MGQGHCPSPILWVGVSHHFPRSERDKLSMPFRSEAQRKFLWAKHPDIAQRWADEYGSKPKKKKKAKGHDWKAERRRLKGE
jgi:hypothetical protein